MYIMYVDESGDIGVDKRTTRYFILSAIVVHELRWNETLDELIDFRRYLKESKGLKLREEIHSSHFLNNPGELVRIPMNDRVDIIKQCIKWLNTRNHLSVFSVRIDKDQAKYTSKELVFETAWQYLIQRFENTINYRNFNGPANTDERGIIIADNTDAPKLRLLYRKMRRFNPTPNIKEVFNEGSRNLPIKLLVEDPIHRDSRDSYFLQLSDVVAYLAYQKYAPNKRAKSKGLHNYYERLSDVLVSKIARNNNLGIVEA